MCPLYHIHNSQTTPRTHKSPSQQHNNSRYHLHLMPRLCISPWREARDGGCITCLAHVTLAHGEPRIKIKSHLHFNTFSGAETFPSFLFCARLMVFRGMNAYVYNKQRTSLWKCGLCVTHQEWVNISGDRYNMSREILHKTGMWKARLLLLLD